MVYNTHSRCIDINVHMGKLKVVFRLFDLVSYINRIQYFNFNFFIYKKS
jgi:hypothetical protein